MKGIILALFIGAVAAYKSYNGYQVIDVVPKTQAEVDYLKSLTNGGQGIDFWEMPTVVGRKARLMLSAHQFVTYTTQMRRQGIEWQVVDSNIGRSVALEKARLERKGQLRAFDINEFNTLADIYDWLNGEALTKCSSAGLQCTLESIGQSFEGREVYMITVSTGGDNKPGIFMDALTHAREWLTTATTLYLMDNMFNTYGTDPDVTRLLDNYNWHFVHVVNPDGYEYTWTDERLYRKNRNTAYCPLGNRGVDLNRNYDHKHGTNGVSHNECDDIYCGPNGNSEPETQNIANWLLNNGANYLYAVITVHSYGNYLLFPWGTTTGWDQPDPDDYPCDLADDHSDLKAVSDATCAAIEETFNTRWDCGNSCITIYTTSGATDDYSKGQCGIKYAYNPELRGNSFIISPNEIEPSFQEFWNGVKAMITAIEANPPF